MLGVVESETFTQGRGHFWSGSEILTQELPSATHKMTTGKLFRQECQPAHVCKVFSLSLSLSHTHTHTHTEYVCGCNAFIHIIYVNVCVCVCVNP